MIPNSFISAQIVNKIISNDQDGLQPPKDDHSPAERLGMLVEIDDSQLFSPSDSNLIYYATTQSFKD